jgi:hypothetical protein
MYVTELEDRGARHIDAVRGRYMRNIIIMRVRLARTHWNVTGEIHRQNLEVPLVIERAGPSNQTGIRFVSEGRL